MIATQLTKVQAMLPSISLAEWSRYCCSGQLPRVVLEALNAGGFYADLVRFASLIGGLEPLAATRPGACDPVVEVERDITVPAAVMDPDTGIVTAAEVRAISFCAPMNRALMIEKSRVTPANLVASQQPVTQPIYKRVNLGTFGEWCFAFEPQTESGQFTNVEHILVPPGGGYSIYVQNYDPTGEAVYNIKARMWASC